MKESTPFPFTFAAILVIYCFIAGCMYNYVKAPLFYHNCWTDWVFYFHIYLTCWVVIPLFVGIHDNYTKGVNTMDSSAVKVVHKTIFMAFVMLVFNYLGLNPNRWLIWFMLLLVNYTLLRMFIHLHPLVFNFLTRINSKYVKPAALVFLLAYFGGIFLSTSLKSELKFFYNEVSLAILSFTIPLKSYFLRVCIEYDLKVMDAPPEENEQ